MFPVLFLLHFKRIIETRKYILYCVSSSFHWTLSVPLWFVLFPCILAVVVDPSVLRGPLLGHTDAVWGLAYSAAHQRLLSCSADGTLRLWNTTEVAPALSVFNDNQGTYLFLLFLTESFVKCHILKETNRWFYRLLLF